MAELGGRRASALLPSPVSLPALGGGGLLAQPGSGWGGGCCGCPRGCPFPAGGGHRSWQPRGSHFPLSLPAQLGAFSVILPEAACSALCGPSLSAQFLWTGDQSSH